MSNKEGQKMRKSWVGMMGLGVLFFVLLTFGVSWGQPTILIVVRASDDSLWKMTCDEVACSPFSNFPGMFRHQPTVTWDEKAQEWVVVGTAADSSIWMATFDKNGVFNNDWQSISGLTPSPAGVSGSFYTIGGLSCASGQVAKWDGSNWVCAPDDVGTVSPGSITSDHIQDGTITNADISASAAIAYSKLSGVASSTHNHDGVYSPLTHNHDATYVNEGQANSISSAMIVDGAVGTVDLANQSVTKVKLSATGGEIGSGAFNRWGKPALADSGFRVGTDR